MVDASRLTERSTRSWRPFPWAPPSAPAVYRRSSFRGPRFPKVVRGISRESRRFPMGCQHRSRRFPKRHHAQFTPLAAPFLVAVAVFAIISDVRWPGTDHPTAVMRARAELISGMSLPDGGLEHAMSLLRTWETLYGLSADSPLPPSAISLPPSIPPPPHLEPCSARTAIRQAAERRGEGGELPPWAQGNAACGNVPQPPWVRGSDSSNLASTRVAQRDIWAHQFPPPSPLPAHTAGPAAGDAGGAVEAGSAADTDDAATAAAACEGKRFLLVQWPDDTESSNSSSTTTTTGTGSNSSNATTSGSNSSSTADGGGRRWSYEALAGQLHGMSVALRVAFTAGRVLVPMPGSFLPAHHPHCQALNASRSLHCYFFRPVSQACEAAAMQHYTSAGAPPCKPLSQLTAQQLGTNETVICAVASSDASYPASANASSERAWSEAYLQRPFLVERQGALLNISNPQLQAHWWTAQALRFLLRWPSPALCHALNRHRNTALGPHIAPLSSSFLAEQRAIVTSLLKPKSEADQGLGLDLRSEGKLLRKLNLSAHRNLETEAWPSLGFSGCLPRKNQGKAVEKSSALTVYQGVGREAYLLRPIVSIHVAEEGQRGGQGEQGQQGELGQEQQQGQAIQERQEGKEEGLRYVWLSTDQTATTKLSPNRLSHFPDWTFLYPKQPSGPSSSSPGYDPVGAAFADLLVASESDFFVGDVASRWSRMVYEIKCTSGRLYAGFLSI
ncbi:unnamed protein product [Closterium sp. Yama58-4]|nr:unnamed protein product [Closterium sp. Yama58-4]